MVKVKSIDKAKRNYKGAASTAAARYKESIADIDWKGPALEAQALYEEQMSNPAVLARRATGIEKTTNEQMKAAMLAKGAPVIGSRMAAADGEWGSGWSPYKSALEAVDLPTRVGDPMTNIDQRLKPIVAALVAKKEEIG